MKVLITNVNNALAPFPTDSSRPCLPFAQICPRALLSSLPIECAIKRENSSKMCYFYAISVPRGRTFTGSLIWPGGENCCNSVPSTFGKIKNVKNNINCEHNKYITHNYIPALGPLCSSPIMACFVHVKQASCASD